MSTLPSGTRRTVAPEETMRRVTPMLASFGITRVADVTGLDELGIPVQIAYRPDSRTMSVSIGTGRSTEQAWVAAVMENIEVWHAENPAPPVVRRAAAAELDLGYDVRDLNLADRSPLTEHTVLDWVAGHGLLTGRQFLVPLGTITLDFTHTSTWSGILFNPTSNGLATGNTPGEASLHGLLELIERDSCTDFPHVALSRRRYVDVHSTDHPRTRWVVQRLRAADCWIEACEITNGLGVPAYAASIWSSDMPITCGGFGADPDGGVALGRALIEAAQSRMAAVSGARDDIARARYDNASPSQRPSVVDHETRPVHGATGPAGSDVDPVLRHCARRVLAHTGVEPFVVDMTHPDIGIATSKVYAPRLRMFDDRAIATRPGAHHG